MNEESAFHDVRSVGWPLVTRRKLTYHNTTYRPHEAPVRLQLN